PYPASPENELVIQSVAIERQQIPGLEPGQQPRLHLRVALEKVVEAFGGRVQHLLGVRRRPLIFRFGQPRNLQGTHQLIVFQRLGAVDFGSTAQRTQVTVLDLPEVIFGLRVYVTEDTAGVGWPKDVGNTVVIAVDGYGVRDLLRGGSDCANGYDP